MNTHGDLTDPLDCASARELLSAELDGELADARELTDHLASCAACRGEAASWRELSNRMAPLRAIEAPSKLWQRIESRVASTAERRRPSVLLRAAAGLIGFGGTLALVRSLDEAERGPQHALEHALTEVTASLAPRELEPLSRTPEQRLLASLAANPEVLR